MKDAAHFFNLDFFNKTRTCVNWVGETCTIRLKMFAGCVRPVMLKEGADKYRQFEFGVNFVALYI